MDTAALDLAAQRYRDAEHALAAARTDLQTEAVQALRAGVRQVEVVRATGWTREYLRKLRQRADEADRPD
jgi:thioredoxin-like negative regulator of GroEL